MATATKVQMTRPYGPKPLIVKEPVGPHYVKELRADGLLTLIGKLWEETQGLGPG